MLPPLRRLSDKIVFLTQYPDHIMVTPGRPVGPKKQPIQQLSLNDEENKKKEREREENKKRVEEWRGKKAGNLIKNSVKVMAKNGGIFFTVTSAGAVGALPNVIGRLIWHMERKYGLLYYTWVRERTKLGFVHWHFAAVFRKRGMRAVHYLKQSEAPGRPARIVELSNWWSKLNSEFPYGNSIRLGWAVKNGRPTKYCLDFGASDYLLKYLRKQKRGKDDRKAKMWGSNLNWLRPQRFFYGEYVSDYDGVKAVKRFECVNSMYFLTRYGIEPRIDLAALKRQPEIFHIKRGSFSAFIQKFYREFKNFHLYELI